MATREGMCRSRLRFAIGVKWRGGTLRLGSNVRILADMAVLLPCELSEDFVFCIHLLTRRRAKSGVIGG